MIEAGYIFSPCYSDCNHERAVSLRPAGWKVFPFPNALLSSCFLLSTTQVPSMASLSSDVQDEFGPRVLKLREGRNAVGVFIPLLPCYEVSLGWLKVTASLQVALSSQLSLWRWGMTTPTLPLQGRVVLQLLTPLWSVIVKPFSDYPVSCRDPALWRQHQPLSSQFLQWRCEGLLLTPMAPATAGEQCRFGVCFYRQMYFLF